MLNHCQMIFSTIMNMPLITDFPKRKQGGFINFQLKNRGYMTKSRAGGILFLNSVI